MYLKPINNTSRGDTIVEVLIALAVISLVLTLSFATTQRSLQIGRQAQERTEALKVAEGQIEKMKALGGLSSSNIFNPAVTQFCFNNTTLETNMPSCTEGPDGRYRKSIVRTSGANNESTFTVTISWDTIGGGNQSQLVLVYKLHEGQF